MYTASDAVVSVPPPDDAGARTADLYEWQAAMAAADGLSLFLQSLHENGQVSADCTAQILCERHEDWVAMCGPDAELVSAKHREPVSGAWTTLTQLVDGGGLAHLFGRWLALDSKPRARLVTCGALAAGPPQQLAAAADTLRTEALDDETQLRVSTAVEALAKALLLHRKGLPQRWHAPDGAAATRLQVGETLLKEMRAFLTALVIDDQRPNRAVTGHAAPSMYAQPILNRLRRTDVPPAAVWEAVVALFRSRMRAKGPVPSGALPFVLTARSIASAATATTSVTLTVEQERDLASRTVTMHDIATAIRISLDNPLGYVPISAPARLTRLSVKMARGGCADTSIERAEHLLIDYRRYKRVRRDIAPRGIAEQFILERALLRAADDATTDSRTAIGAWGTRFWVALADHLTRIPAGERPEGLDDELARGGVCDLAARCKVWFSARFDVDGEINRLQAERRASP